jgi:hypothetical protein
MGLKHVGERKTRIRLVGALETELKGAGFDPTRAFGYLQGNLHSFP